MVAPRDNDPRGHLAASLHWRTDAFDRRCAELELVTDAQIAQRGGIDRWALQDWRQGTRVPRLDRAMDFAARFDLTVTDLWEWN